jgi:hypothetical protein
MKGDEMDRACNTNGEKGIHIYDSGGKLRRKYTTRKT